MPLPPDHISVTNVRPAYATSLARGMSPASLAAVGLPAETMADDDAAVPGAATYAHMEAIQRQDDVGGFLVEAARRHTGESLGIVGLACKTVPTVAEAFLCHARFQHLTNRTAHYTHAVDGEDLVLTEHRHGPPRPGSLLLSDYALLVAVQLLSVAAERSVPVVAMASRRSSMPADERTQLEEAFQCPVSLGATHASLTLPLSVLALEIPRADPELAAYFQQVLARAARFDEGDSALVAQCRRAIQEALPHGTPTGGMIGRQLGMSQRTLQRRLQDEGLRWTDLVADTRMRLAKGYLADERLSVAETAFLLGYQDDTSFFRAFRRWTGQTPTQWRADRA
jgi:AraC-like DNA-binding protein